VLPGRHATYLAVGLNPTAGITLPPEWRGSAQSSAIRQAHGQHVGAVAEGVTLLGQGRIQGRLWPGANQAEHGGQSVRNEKSFAGGDSVRHSHGPGGVGAGAVGPSRIPLGKPQEQAIQELL